MLATQAAALQDLLRRFGLESCICLFHDQEIYSMQVCLTHTTALPVAATESISGLSFRASVCVSELRHEQL